MHTNSWTAVAAIGQWAGALASAAVAITAVIQTRRANQKEKEAVWAAEAARIEQEVQRRNYLLKGLYMEMQENKRLILDLTEAKAAKPHLHRESWVVAQPEVFVTDKPVAEICREAYRLATRLNDIARASLAIEPRYENEHQQLDKEYQKTVEEARKAFDGALQALRVFLEAHGVSLK